MVLKAKERMLLPAFKGSMLRGGFGHVLKHTCCSVQGSPCVGCILQEKCPYAYLFETAPRHGSSYLSKNSQVPRPYLFEPPLDGRRVYEAGEELSFGLVLIGRSISFLPYFIYAIQELGNIGVTRRKYKYELLRVDAVEYFTGHFEPIYSNGDRMVSNRAIVGTYSDCINYAAKMVSDKVSIKFTTPTRIKYAGKYWFNDIPFVALVQNLTIRANALALLHCDSGWDERLKALRDEAAGVVTAWSGLTKVDVIRYSSRQGKPDTLSGAVGSITYEAKTTSDNTEYRNARQARQSGLSGILPLLVLGQIIHVGSDCVFGCGKYVIGESEEPETRVNHELGAWINQEK
jgi:hypothetical protein